MVSPVHTDRVYLTICPLILCWYENCNSKEFQSATKLVSRCLEKFGKGEFNIEGNASKNKFQLMSASLPKKAIEVRITLFDYFIDVRSTFKGRFPKLIAKAKEIYSTYCEQGRMQGAATASNAAPQNKSFLKMLGTRLSNLTETIVRWHCNAMLTSVGQYNFSCCPVFSTIPDSMQYCSLFSYN